MANNRIAQSILASGAQVARLGRSIDAALHLRQAVMCARRMRLAPSEPMET